MEISKLNDELYEILRKNYSTHIGYAAHRRAINEIAMFMETSLGVKIEEDKRPVIVTAQIETPSQMETPKDETKTDIPVADKKQDKYDKDTDEK